MQVFLQDFSSRDFFLATHSYSVDVSMMIVHLVGHLQWAVSSRFRVRVRAKGSQTKTLSREVVAIDAGCAAR